MVSFAPEVLKSILMTMKFVAVLLSGTVPLPKPEAPPSEVLLTVPKPNSVSDPVKPPRKPANRLVALLPFKNTPTASPPELPLFLMRKLMYFVPLDMGLAKFTVFWLPLALC